MICGGECTAGALLDLLYRHSHALEQVTQGQLGGGAGAQGIPGLRSRRCPGLLWFFVFVKVSVLFFWADPHYDPQEVEPLPNQLSQCFARGALLEWGPSPSLGGTVTSHGYYPLLWQNQQNLRT